MAVANIPVSISEVRGSHKDLVSAEQARVAGDLNGAQQACQDLLKRQPDYVGALSTLALIHMQRGAYGQALPLLVKANMLNPRNWVTLTNAGRVYLELDSPESAIRQFEKSLNVSPDEHSTLYLLGRALTITQHYERAREVLERACAAGSGESATPIWLCECYLHLQQYDDAARVFNEALKTPMNRDVKAYAYRLASAFPENIKLDLDILSSLNSLGEPQSDDQDVTQHNIAFTRALCLERLGRHKESWDAMVAANVPLEKKYRQQAQIHSQQEEELLASCRNWNPPRKNPAKEAQAYPVSLFILGVSRSGKTTVESLIGTLAGVKMLQENDLTTSTAQHISQRAGLLTAFHLCRLPKNLDPEIAKTYRARLLKCAGDAKIVTFTHPGVISDVGRLMECAPNPKFLFMKRNDDDVAFRIFGQLYRENTNQYAYDLNAIYRHVSNHNVMADNWLEKLDKQAIAVQYEDMVKDPESTLAQVAEFCGLKPPSKLEQKIADDSGCAEPYQKWLHEARG